MERERFVRPRLIRRAALLTFLHVKRRFDGQRRLRLDAVVRRRVVLRRRVVAFLRRRRAVVFLRFLRRVFRRALFSTRSKDDRGIDTPAFPTFGTMRFDGVTTAW